MVYEVHVRVLHHPVEFIAWWRALASVTKDVSHRPHSMPYPSYIIPKPMLRAVVPR